MYVDSHIHLQDYKTQDIKNVVTNAAQNGVTHFINPSARPKDWDKVAELALLYPQLVPAFGVHPWHIDEVPADWEQRLENMLNKYPTAFVGECGIDRLKNPDTVAQIKILRFHAELAQKYHRPLIIHSVKADSEMASLFDALPKRTVFHSFTGSAEWGKMIQNRGFFIGLNFSILRKKNAAEILRSLNLRQILLETDGPYQNIERGSETLPQNLPDLAQKIAVLLQMPTAELEELIVENQNVFLGERK
ncbi:MAG: TatD family hydrolase [Alphaproteobacteria bacterium]|nr:TatD family hydrolase [Alphaproteobacteria bacterium]